MQISHTQPPNIEEIRKVFTFTRRVIFAYDNTIYNPEGVRLDAHMIAHEEVHFKQQRKMGVDKWWKQYLKSPAFRAEQEMPAYRAQYQSALNSSRRGFLHLHRYGHELALALSGDTYGHCIPYSKALKFITS